MKTKLVIGEPTEAQLARLALAGQTARRGGEARVEPGTAGRAHQHPGQPPQQWVGLDGLQCTHSSCPPFA